jgi:AraC-like DNA-binding protein
MPSKLAAGLLSAFGPVVAEIAACAGFSDQSQFSHHFKRVVGVTPRQFRSSARIA